jgi:hypothetical protein
MEFRVPMSTDGRTPYETLCIAAVEGHNVPADPITLAIAGISQTMFNVDVAELRQRRAAAETFARTRFGTSDPDPEAVARCTAESWAARQYLEATAAPAARREVERLRQEYADANPGHTEALDRARRVLTGLADHIGRNPPDPLREKLAAAESLLLDWRTWRSRFERSGSDA